MDKGKDILILNALWVRTDSNTITDNVENLLISNGCKTFSERWNKLTEITSSTKHAVYAWLNRGRTNVKIPFLKLCKIAEKYDVEINTLLTGGKFMFEKKFAVTRTIDSKETVLRFFREDEKEAAMAYGAEVAKTNNKGVIACVLALFDENDNMKNYECKVFEVWQ